ncbi:uncharacterized protein [Euphorbia lathyris]|uniref:uncharacterized protein n=1 Tax=Euphorbia lathyris TaxID=212925 RepID=UPI0033134C85
MSSNGNENAGQASSEGSVGQSAPTRLGGNSSLGVPNFAPAMQQFVEAIGTMAAQLQNQFQNVQAHAPLVPSFDRNLEGLRRLGAETFKGTLDPEEAEVWLIKVEDVLNSMNCPLESRVRYTVTLLAGDALIWWKAVMRGRDDQAVTWEDFRNLFNDKYCSQEYRDEKQMEFMNLKQNEMSIAEYENRFAALSRYAPLMTEDERCRRFERGLTPRIKACVANCVKNYRILHETAAKLEKAFNEGETLAAKRARSESQGEQGRSTKRSGSQSFTSGRGSFSQSGSSYRGGGRFGGSSSADSGQVSGGLSTYCSPSFRSNRGSSSGSGSAFRGGGRRVLKP